MGAETTVITTVLGGGGAVGAWTASPAMTAPTIATTAVIGATTAAVNGSWARLYTQPLFATATALTAGTTVTWTPTVGTNIYTLTPAQTETINMGTIPAGCVGQYMVLNVVTSGTTSFVCTFGTNIKSQGTLTTGTVTAMNFSIVFFIKSTTSVIEMSRTIAM